MRFYFGFSKRFSIKKIIKWIPLIATGLLAFFGIDKLTAHALIVNTGAESVRTCPYNDVFTSSSCVLQQSIQCQTGYGLANCYAATTSNSTLAQKSTWYHFVTNTSNGNCNTSQTVSFNASVILNQNIGLNGDNANNWFDPNALNYPYWQGNSSIITRNGNLKSVKENVNTRALFTGYWPYLADWTGTRNENKNGVRLYWKTPNNTFGDTYCTFLSYGNNNLTLNYSCTAPAKQLYYQVGINQYNNAGGLSSSNIYSEASLKISGVSDPCASGGSSGGTFDDSNIVEAINDNTLNITNAIDGLTDGVNSATADIMDKQDLTNDKLDEVNDNLEGIGESVDRLTCNKINVSNAKNIGFLDSTGSVVNESTWRFTDYISFSSIKSYYLRGIRPSICFYKDDKTLLSCFSEDSFNWSNVNSNIKVYAKYFRVSFNYSDSNFLNTYIEYCTNPNGSTIVSSNEVDSFLSDLESMIDDQPIQRLLTMPITLLNSFYNNVSTTTCSPYNVALTLPGNHTSNISFTCFDYNNLIGSTGATLLDAFMCFGLCWGIAHAAIHFYEECSSAKDTFDELYKGGK